uniref:Uncharacterized protein n=1 Tax=Globisporangium ultimum (strain ATCC 200006 / CBS 805.95 / DAOM BR144) TaxID=431595 RepID=K3WJL2_GLOUD
MRHQKIASTIELRFRHDGLYSVERLIAVQEYISNRSLGRACIVCIVTSVPPLVAILLVDALPLQSPSAGWDHNASLWIRLFISAYTLAFGVTLQFQGLVLAACLTIKKGMRVSLFTAAGYTAFLLMLSKYWVFPIPFTFVVGVPAWMLCFYLGIAFATKINQLKKSPEFQTQMKRFIKKLYLESNFLLIYPVYNTVFLALSHRDQVVFVFVLPLVKVSLKKIMAAVAGDVDDIIPCMVISVDIFNALYQSKCMQSSGSMWTTAVIILIDTLQSVYSLRHLSKQTHEVEVLGDQSINTKGLLAYVLELINAPDQLDENVMTKFRVRAFTRMRAPSGQEQIVQNIQLLQTKVKQSTSISMALHAFVSKHLSSLGSLSRRGSFLSATQVVPLPPALRPASTSATVKNTSTSDAEVGSESATQLRLKTQKATMIRKALQLLWSCELLLLVEYIEAAIPFMYAIYLVALAHLPNAEYYPGMDQFSSTKLTSVVTSITIYGCLELISLLCVHMVLRRKFNLSALHQLACVFEGEWLILQGTIMGWIVVVLQFTLKMS